MSDMKSKMPDFKELASMTSKFFNDIKTSVGQIIQDYKDKRPEDDEVNTQTTDVPPVVRPDVPPVVRPDVPPVVKPDVSSVVKPKVPPVITPDPTDIPVTDVKVKTQKPSQPERDIDPKI